MKTVMIFEVTATAYDLTSHYYPARRENFSKKVIATTLDVAKKKGLKALRENSSLRHVQVTGVTEYCEAVK